MGHSNQHDNRPLFRISKINWSKIPQHQFADLLFSPNGMVRLQFILLHL